MKKKKYSKRLSTHENFCENPGQKWNSIPHRIDIGRKIMHIEIKYSLAAEMVPLPKFL